MRGHEGPARDGDPIERCGVCGGTLRVIARIGTPEGHREDPYPSRCARDRLHRPPTRTAAACARSAIPGLPTTDRFLTASTRRAAATLRLTSCPRPHSPPGRLSSLPVPPNRIASTAKWLRSDRQRTCQRPHQYSPNQRRSAGCFSYPLDPKVGRSPQGPRHAAQDVELTEPFLASRRETGLLLQWLHPEIAIARRTSRPSCNCLNGVMRDSFQRWKRLLATRKWSGFAPTSRRP